MAVTFIKSLEQLENSLHRYTNVSPQVFEVKNPTGALWGSAQNRVMISYKIM
jgi:hypothetical protein